MGIGSGRFTRRQDQAGEGGKEDGGARCLLVGPRGADLYSRRMAWLGRFENAEHYMQRVNKAWTIPQYAAEK